MRFKHMVGVSATFMMASERAKMHFALPACHFSARESPELVQSTQRGLREVPERTQTSGSQVHRVEKMGLAPCLQGAHSCGGGSKAVVCVFQTDQSYSDLASTSDSTALSLEPRNNNGLFPFFLCPFSHAAIFMLHLLAHGSITVGPDLQPVFQTLLLARGGERQVCLNTHCAVSRFGSGRYLEI